MQRLIPGLFLLLAQPALAQALPPAVKTMVEAAVRTGDKAKSDAVVAIAKETNKGAEAEIDAIVAAVSAEMAARREAELKSAGLLDNWSGSGQLGASVASGNSNTKTFSAGLVLKKEGLRWRHRFDAIADIVDNNSADDQRRILASYQADWKLSERFYLYGRLGYEQNREAGIRRRFTQSLGAGWRAVDGTALKWDLEAGPALRQTRFVTGDENSFAGRGASRIAWTLTDSMLFTNDTSIFWDRAGSINNTAALTAKLMGALSARLAFNLAWEEDPPLGLDNLDTVTRITLVYDF
jgi:putative salt-induced outer membrane protein